MVIMFYVKDMWKGEYQKFKICVKENEILYQNDSRLNVMRKKKKGRGLFFLIKIKSFFMRLNGKVLGLEVGAGGYVQSTK